MYVSVKRSFSSLNSILKCFSGKTIMIFRKFCMFKDLKELQVSGCQTDVCLVGAGGEKVFIHRTMLFADHVQSHPVWHQLDPVEGDCKGFSVTNPFYIILWFCWTNVNVKFNFCIFYYYYWYKHHDLLFLSRKPILVICICNFVT